MRFSLKIIQKYSVIVTRSWHNIVIDFLNAFRSFLINSLLKLSQSLNQTYIRASVTSFNPSQICLGVYDSKRD